MLAPRLRLLIVDDDRIVRETIVKEAAATERFEIEEAENGAQGLERYFLFKPHILVSDYEMPILDGPKLVAAVRKQAGSQKTLIALLTARSSGADVMVGLAAGADEYWRKPFAPGEVRSRLGALTRLIDLQATLENTLLKLEEAQKQQVAFERGQLAGFISQGLCHELNNPLAALRAAVEFAKRHVEKLPDKKSQDAAEALREASLLSDRIQHTVRRVTVFQRAQHAAVPEPVFLKAAVEKVLRQAKHRPVATHLRGDDRLQVFVDPLHLDVALVAIVDAIIERGEGPLAVEVRTMGGNAVVKLVANLQSGPPSPADAEQLEALLAGGLDLRHQALAAAEFGLPVANDCVVQNGGAIRFSASDEGLVTLVRFSAYVQAEPSRHTREAEKAIAQN